MPNSKHFEWSQSTCSHDMLALPRPESSPRVGGYVTLALAWESCGVADGPLAPGDVGIVVEDTGCADKPFLVQELVSGRLWWYCEAALQPMSADRVPHDLLHPAHPGEGSYVTLAYNYKSFSDAGRGPLSLLRVEDTYGMVLMESGQRFRVRSCHTRQDWWFDHGAVRPVHMKYVPESLRAQVRPAWGDYVALTHDHADFGSAADGPLEAGNLGVVVAVHDVPDSNGGLMQPRYTVRACHNGQAYRYHEGALHLVVQQLLHAPKVPPSSGKGRRRKLSCAMHISHAGSGAAVGTGQVLVRGQVQQVHVVCPGTKYWITARLTCKDDDLMLANLKPCAWDLFAPSGRPGHFIQLKPVKCKQQQQQQRQQRRQQGPEFLSLAYCNDAAGAGAAAGSCAWYNPIDDEVFCAFEWDSSETPLAIKPHRVTEVNFVWGVCFNGISGQFTKQHTLHLQTAPQSSNSSSSTQEAADAAAASPPAAPTPDVVACNVLGSSSVDDDGSSSDSSDSSAHSIILDWVVGGHSQAATAAATRRQAGSSGSDSSSEDDSDGSEDESAIVAANGRCAGGRRAADDGGSSSSSSSGSSSEDSDEGDEAEEEETAAAAADGSDADDDADNHDNSGDGDAAGDNNSSGSSSGFSPDNIDGQGGHGNGNGSSNDGGFSNDGHGTGPPTPLAGLSGPGAATRDLPEAAAGTARADIAQLPSLQLQASPAGAAAASASHHADCERSSSSSNGGIISALHGCDQSNCGAAADAGSSSSRWPSTPELQTAGGRSRGDTAFSAASGCSSSQQATHSSSSSSSAAARSSSSEARDSAPHRDQQVRLGSNSGAASSSSSSSSSSFSGFRSSATTSSMAATAAAAAAATMQARPVSSGGVSAGCVVSGSADIQQIMLQVERQAESNQPLWQEGTELAAALAAKAMAAAEEWQRKWCRHRRQQQQQHEDIIG